jgi:hypothetical protein
VIAGSGVASSALAEPGPLALPARPVEASSPDNDGADSVAEPASQRLAQLLESSARWETGDPEVVLLALVEGMLPDEARLLAALADDADHLVLEVAERAGRGGHDQIVVRVSAVGRSAGVRDLDLLPWYLARLEARGLVVFGTAGAAERADRPGYDRLAVEPVVTAAVRDIEARGRRATLTRMTVRRSALARSLWDAMDRQRD